MSTLRCALLFALALTMAHGALSQVPTKCLEIERVLVDACNTGCPGAQEGENEMFRFIIGPQPIALANLTAQWATPNAFLGWVQNAATASLTAQLNATIENCGHLLEPPNGVIPAGRRVLGITSTNMCVLSNSFAGLSDTLYVIYQAPGNTFGHFKNTSNSNAITTTPTGTTEWRTFVLGVPSAACFDSAFYNIALLVNQNGTYGGPNTINDGASIAVSWPGVPVTSYINPGCQAPFTPITATITTVPQPVACGGSIALSGTTTGNVASTFWSGGIGTFSTTAGTSTTYTTGPGDGPGPTLSFCAVSACGDTLCDQVFVPVLAPPAVSIVPVATPIACGASVALNSEVNGPYTSALWIGGTGTWSDQSSLTPVYTTGPMDSGPIWLTLCVQHACGAPVCAEVELLVEGGPQPTISATAPSPICSGTTTTLTASGGATYMWSTGATVPAITVDQAGVYTVEASNACGTGSATFTLEVTPAPVAVIAAPPTICPGVPAVLEATGGTAYLWSTGASTPSITVDQPGTYTVTVSDACGSDTASMTLIAGTAYQPVIAASAVEGCAPLCVIFSAEEIPGVAYAWTFSDGTTAEGRVVEHCAGAGALQATVLVTGPAGGLCPATTSLAAPVQVWPLPSAAFTADPAVTTLERPTIHFIPADVQAAAYLWHFGDALEHTSTAVLPSHTYTEAGTYTVHLQLWNAYGCTALGELPVRIEDPYQTWAPNAFTPNGDGINDFFRVISTVLEPSGFELLIFDRWGQVCFTGLRPDAAWDGADAPDGVYVWRLRVRDTLGQWHEHRGYVTLLR